MGCGESKLAQPVVVRNEAAPERKPAPAKPAVSAEEGARRASVTRIGNLELADLEKEYAQRLQSAGASSAAPVDYGSCNILMLGASDCGKSTLYRQLVQHFGVRNDEHTWLLFVGVVRGQLFALLGDLMVGMRTLGIAYEKPDTQSVMASLLKNRAQVNNVMSWKQFAYAYAGAVQDAGVRDALRRAEELHLGEHAEYFVDNAMRIFAPGYVPSDADVVRLAVRTTGVASEEIELLETVCQVHDVGGMRSERKKWSRQISSINVHAVFFVASLSEFTQALCEDAAANRMGESLQVLRDAMSMPALQKASFFLFLTKEDRLASKLDGNAAALWPSLKAQLSEGAPDDGDARAAAALIKERFAQECPRCAQAHVLTATNSDDARRALEKSLLLVLSEHAARTGQKLASPLRGAKSRAAPLPPIGADCDPRDSAAAARPGSMHH